MDVASASLGKITNSCRPVATHKGDEAALKAPVCQDKEGLLWLSGLYQGIPLPSKGYYLACIRLSSCQNRGFPHALVERRQACLYMSVASACSKPYLQVHWALLLEDL